MVQEHFSLHIPRTLFGSAVVRILLSLIIAALIVYSSIGFKELPVSLFSLLLLAFLIHLLLSSFTITHDGLSTDSTTYPVPPHLGLDGISIENRISGL